MALPCTLRVQQFRGVALAVPLPLCQKRLWHSRVDSAGSPACESRKAEFSRLLGRTSGCLDTSTSAVIVRAPWALALGQCECQTRTLNPNRCTRERT